MYASQAKDFNPFATASAPTPRPSSLPTTYVQLSNPPTSYKPQQPTNSTVILSTNKTGRMSRAPEKTPLPANKIATAKKKGGLKTIKIRKAHSEPSITPRIVQQKKQLSGKAMETQNKE